MKDYDKRHNNMHKTKSEKYFLNFKDFMKTIGTQNQNKPADLVNPL